MRTGIPQPWFLRELCAPLLEPSVVQQHSLPPSPVRRRLGDGGKSNTSGSLSFNFRLSTVSFPYQLPCFDILPNCSALRVTIAPLFSQPYKLLFPQTPSFDNLTNCRGYTLSTAIFVAAQGAISFVSCCCALFCTLSTFNSLAFNYLRVLSQKHPGGGIRHSEELPKWDTLDSLRTSATTPSFRAKRGIPLEL